MQNDGNRESGTPNPEPTQVLTPNPAKEVQTQELPTIFQRDSADKVNAIKRRGEKK